MLQCCTWVTFFKSITSQRISQIGARHFPLCQDCQGVTCACLTAVPTFGTTFILCVELFMHKLARPAALVAHTQRIRSGSTWPHSIKPHLRQAGAIVPIGSFFLRQRLHFFSVKYEKSKEQFSPDWIYKLYTSSTLDLERPFHTAPHL